MLLYCTKEEIEGVYEKKQTTEKLVKSLKLTLGAVIAILIASQLNLLYPTSAGIITLLSVQNTKRETIQRARNRGIAFLFALLIGVLCFLIGGYSIASFAIYIFIFSLLCYHMEWIEAIAMSTVLVSHLLLEQSLTIEMLLNEIGLFVIGAGVGIVVNLHLRKKESEFKMLADDVDQQMKSLLGRMAQWILLEDKKEYKEKEALDRLEMAIEGAKFCAITNLNNTFKNQSVEELNYIEMREQQSLLLREIYRNIKRMRCVPVQVQEVSIFFQQLQDNFHKNNTVLGALSQLSSMYERMKEQELPISREEFETRAILFYILLEVRKLLELKKTFIQENM